MRFVQAASYHLKPYRMKVRRFFHVMQRGDGQTEYTFGTSRKSPEGYFVA